MGHKNDPRGLHLIPKKEGAVGTAPEPRPDIVRIERNGYVAEIIASLSKYGDIYHYVIQPVGSRDIVHWGQEVSMQRAKEMVESYLDDFGRMQKGQ
jgi:hypothetical protein